MPFEDLNYVPEVCILKECFTITILTCEQRKWLPIIPFTVDDNCPECDKVLEELENIDDDTDKHGIYFVRIDDDAYAKELGVSEFPSLVYFENGSPSIYMGKLTLPIHLQLMLMFMPPCL